MKITPNNLAAEVSSALLLLAESEGIGDRTIFPDEIIRRAKTQEPIELTRAVCQWFLEVTSKS